MLRILCRSCNLRCRRRWGEKAIGSTVGHQAPGMTVWVLPVVSQKITVWTAHLPPLPINGIAYLMEYAHHTRPLSTHVTPRSAVNGSMQQRARRGKQPPVGRIGGCGQERKRLLICFLSHWRNPRSFSNHVECRILIM
ncbi:hypothetical protein M407DRAFT_191643 [Tulasnella calospora MUT 4182]|uniref:Uncharacterized protein n=1 Tax=Tulasnella calospora MUT 4182 TaxID=1051891 RepID=A0A0C3L0Z7_9AGAM|nr:hypothetical protein M407DRAFT_191643 [Tulasnella calospora MUT 4182]